MSLDALRRALPWPVAAGLCLCLSACAKAATPPSVCYGTLAQGRLEGGVALPASGANFEAYSQLGVALDRNYVHAKVRDVVVDAYAIAAQQAPETRYVYGETGWPQGGRFRPHKSHQNGLSVDFFVPVRRDGKPVQLPTGPLTKFGYAIEFDAMGHYGDDSIDFDAMAIHLLALHQAADRQGIRISRVIFDNQLQTLLFADGRGAALKSALTFSTKKPWVRHDEHYHVDFDVPCLPYGKPLP
ncbi:MAG: penicillin-insensitive murein endopeptidase [Solimonas sp.]